jgi:hypothetical protein
VVPRFVVVCLLLTSSFVLVAQPAFTQKKAERVVLPARTVLDDASFFSKDAREQANTRIARIRSQFDKDLLIESVDTVVLPKEIDEKDTAAVNRFFDARAAQRFKAFAVDGVFVSIVKHPPKFRIEVGSMTAKRLFTRDNYMTMSDRLSKDLAGGDMDKALANLVSFTQDTMAKNSR